MNVLLLTMDQENIISPRRSPCMSFTRIGVALNHMSKMNNKVHDAQTKVVDREETI